MTTNNSKAQKHIYLPFFVFLLPELFHEKRAEKSREAQLQSVLFSLFSKRPLQLSLSIPASSFHLSLISQIRRAKRGKNREREALRFTYFSIDIHTPGKKKRCAIQRALAPSLISALCFKVVTPSFFFSACRSITFRVTVALYPCNVQNRNKKKTEKK